MERKLAVRLLTIAMLCALMPFLVVPTAVDGLPIAAAAPAATHISASGPFADSIIYRVIAGQDVQVAALVSGDIDHLADYITGSYIQDLQANPAITVSQTERLGFGHMTINCGRYPYSSPYLRRAIAYAVDKYDVSTIMWESLGFPLDSVVPASCGAWHNNHTTPNYFESDLEAARAELAAGGFVDIDNDGWVEAPNGQDFTMRVFHSATGTNWAAALQSAKTNCWDPVGIPIQPTPMDFNAFIARVQTIPRDYDAACFGYSLSSPQSGPTSLQAWLSTEIANPYGNIWNWANDTFDDQVNTVLSATDYNEVLEACWAAQQTMAENCPIVVLYSNWVVDAWRNTRWEGFVVEPGHGTGAMNFWTPRKVHLKAGQTGRDPDTGCGGTFLSMISQDMDTQNPLTSTTVYGSYVLGQIYQGLQDLNNPNTLTATEDNGGLTYAWTIEELPNQMKYTFKLYTNATWQDGDPVTPEDVAFSYNYIKQYNLPRYATVIPYLDNATVKDNDEVIIYSNPDYSGAKSYFAFESLRGWIILPEHIWEGIVSPTTFTNPLPVGCGPYKWYRRIEGEYVQLNFWELYHRGIIGHQRQTTTATSYTFVYVAVGALVIVVVLLGSVWYLRKK